MPGGKLPDISTFVTSQENLVNYTFKSLNLDRNEISETICSGSSDFCCSFKITVIRNSSVPLNYAYKWVDLVYLTFLTDLTYTFSVKDCLPIMEYQRSLLIEAWVCVTARW